MNVTVIGCGRWGSLIAWYLDKNGHKVSLYGRESSAHMQRFLKERRNELLTLPQSIDLSTDISVTSTAEVIVIAIASQSLRSLLSQLATIGTKDKIIVLCMKGIEIETTKRLSEIAADLLDSSCKIAVWLGPGHVQEFYSGIPNCMVIDCDDEKTKTKLVDEFSSDLIRFYYGTDLLGNEIGAAAKNVIGIAAGMLDGLGLGTLKGALMSRGTREIARLIKVMGGNELSAYGLCHLGDYEATVFSRFSHNRSFGEAFVKGEEFSSLAEGYYTVCAMVRLADKYNVELPICQAVYEILYNGRSASKTIDELFNRSFKKEF